MCRQDLRAQWPQLEPQHDIYCVNHVGKTTLEIHNKYGLLDFLRKNSNI